MISVVDSANVLNSYVYVASCRTLKCNENRSTPMNSNFGLKQEREILVGREKPQSAYNFMAWAMIGNPLPNTESDVDIDNAMSANRTKTYRLEMTSPKITCDK